MPNGYPYYQPYYPPPVYYPPPEKKSNLGAMIVVGGLAAVGISAALLYLLSKQNKPECTIDADCQTGYVCENNKCVLAYDCINDTDCPPGYICQNHKCVHEFIPCTDGQCAGFDCEPRWNGIQRCDTHHNLCRCDGSAWQLLQESSSACANCFPGPCDSPRYNDCFVDENGKALCYWNMGYGADLCPDVGMSRGCHCSPSIDCDAATHCCDDNKCRDKPVGFFNATCGNGLTCWSEGTSRYAQYNFNDAGITGFKLPVAYHALMSVKVRLAGSQIGFWDGVLWDSYNNSGWREVMNPLTDPCLFGCNPLSFGDWSGPWRCMDSFQIGIASPTGPPNITGVEFTFL